MGRVLAAAFLLFGISVAAFAAPDPRDSVIIESKTITPLAGACASAGFRVKVWITNKDSLANITLPLLTRSTSGGAYGTLSRPVSCSNRLLVSHCFDFLFKSASGLPYLPTRIVNYNDYHSDSPDTFRFSFTLDMPIDEGKFPPNPTRALLGEIKFDSVFANLGQFEIDSVPAQGASPGVQFVALTGQVIKPNFAKGIVTVLDKGDMNADGALTSADVVLLLTCAFEGLLPPAGSGSCDVNCDGVSTGADVVLELNKVFLSSEFPC